MCDKIRELERRVEQLEKKLEKLDNELEELSYRLEDWYEDLARRIRELEEER